MKMGFYYATAFPSFLGVLCRYMCKPTKTKRYMLDEMFIGLLFIF